MMKKYNNRAFTLIELLVVISIIGILITLVTVAVLPIQKKSRDSKRKADVNLMLAGLGLFNADFKIYPNYTFYLGTNNVDNGATNSNYGLENNIPTCNGNLSGATPTPSAGNPSLFTLPVTASPTTTQLQTTTTIKLKDGFASVNNFLICLKYMDKLVQDPKFLASDPKTGYHYRVGYDYSEFLVGAELENTSDPDAKVLLGSGAKRYWVGNGSNNRQLDDDSDVSPGVGGEGSGGWYKPQIIHAAGTPPPATGFYTYNPALTDTNTDGKYFYQCISDGIGGIITLDNRATINPFKLTGSIWGVNVITPGTATTCSLIQPQSSSSTPIKASY